MKPCSPSGGLRRAAALTLFLTVAVTVPTAALAQEYISDYGSSVGGTVISDGGMSGYGGQYDGPYDDSYGCNPYCDDGDGAPCFNDGYKHYCPVWVGAEWLHWRLDGSHLPPLVTDGPANSSINSVARLNDPNTRILSGDQTVNDGWRSVYRVFGGVWLDQCRTCGVGVDY